MTAYRADRPRALSPAAESSSTLPDANRAAEGANPLCGDRIRIQLRVDGDTIAEARFTADACALCIASASLLTEHVRGMSIERRASIDGRWIRASLGGDRRRVARVRNASPRHAETRHRRDGMSHVSAS